MSWHDPVELWARSGAMALTGRTDGPPLLAPGRPAAVAQESLDDVARAALARTGSTPRLPGVELLGQRAALAGLHRSGSSSCGGGCVLLECADGHHLALSLPRASDRELVPALVERRVDSDHWAAIASWAASTPSRDALDRCRLLGLAASSTAGSECSRPAVTVTHGGPRRQGERPLVVDLSSLWAGPLCTQLLAASGANVVKIESVRRPDGARGGPSRFFDVLNGGKQMVAIDFQDRAGLAALASLLERADLVVEASRPRALRQLGFIAEEYIDAGINWLSITARGRDSDTIGFGDDVAVGGGLFRRDDEGPMHCGDALADPLTGCVAASAAAESFLGRRAQLIDVSMQAVAATAAGPLAEHETIERDGRWTVVAPGGEFPVTEPRVPRRARRAAHLGAHTSRVLR